MSHHTYFKHYNTDAVFKEAVDEAMREYGDRLEGVARRNALNPRSVIERIFILKSLFPHKYADQRAQGSTLINLVFDNKSLDDLRKRTEIIDV